MTTYVEEVRMVVKANRGSPPSGPERQDRGDHHRHHSVQTLRKNERAGGIDFKGGVWQDHADSFLMLETGRARRIRDGRLHPGGQHLQVQEPCRLQDRGRSAERGTHRLHAAQGRPAFKKAVDDSIKRQIKDGSLAKLYDKWFMQPVPPANVDRPALS